MYFTIKVRIKQRPRELKLPKQKIVYLKEYADQVIEHMRSGNTFKSFAQVINVSYSTIHRWTIDYPDFAKAKAEGDKLQMLKKGWK